MAAVMLCGHDGYPVLDQWVLPKAKRFPTTRLWYDTQSAKFELTSVAFKII